MKTINDRKKWKAIMKSEKPVYVCALTATDARLYLEEVFGKEVQAELKEVPYSVGAGRFGGRER